MSEYDCDSCLRIVPTEDVSVVIPTIFGIDMVFDGKLCQSCHSLMDWFNNYQFLEIYEEQSKKIVEKKFRLTSKT